MSFSKNKLLIVTALCGLSTLAAKTHLEFCKKDKVYCETQCASSNGYLLEVGKYFNNLTHHHDKGGHPDGFLCLSHKIQKCNDASQCQTDTCCSNAYELLDEDNKVCLPSRFCNVQRVEGESCLTDSMCASNRCSQEGKCQSLKVSQKFNQAKKNEDPSGIPRRGFIKGSKNEKRILQSSPPFDMNALAASLASLATTSASSASGTYSTSQYCPSNKAYYYSKAYFCPATPSASSSSTVKKPEDTFDKAFDSAYDSKKFDKALDAFASTAASTYKSFLAAVIGGTVGGVIFIIILIVICCYCCCKKQKAAPAPMTPGDPVQTTMQTMQPYPQPMTINV